MAGNRPDGASLILEHVRFNSPSPDTAAPPTSPLARGAVDSSCGHYDEECRLSQAAVVVACGAASEGRDRARSAHDLEPDRRVEKRGLEERMKTVKGPPIDGLPLLSRPRRFSIADLMAAVGLAALGM